MQPLRAARRRAALLAIASLGACVSIEPQDVDVEPLMEAPVPESLEGLQALLPSYEWVARGGAQVATGSRRSDGVRDLLRRDWREGARSGTYWVLSARLLLFGSESGARSDFDILCEQALEPRVSGGRGSDRYCVSALVQLRSDPEGGFLPSNRHLSTVAIQRGRLVVSITEVRTGSQDVIQKGATIRELAAALQQLRAQQEPS